MKFILVPILMVLLLAQVFSKWLVVMEYNLNKNYIAKNLCINKTKPKLHCNGKCQMMKRLAEEEKQNSSNSNNTIKVKTADVVFSDKMNKVEVPAPAPLPISHNEEPPIAYSFMTLSSVFHPPSIG